MVIDVESYQQFNNTELLDFLECIFSLYAR